MHDPNLFFAGATGGATLAATGAVLGDSTLSALGSFLALASACIGFYLQAAERVSAARRHQELLDHVQALQLAAIDRQAVRAQPDRSQPLAIPK
jgi:hypothetical protein